VFEKVGLFDERFDACEDVEFNTRIDAAGLKCYFTPMIAVHYYPRSSIKGLAYQMSRYGRGRLRLAGKHPRSLSIPAIAPMAFAVGMIACAVLSLVFPIFAAVFCLGGLAYTAVVGAATAALWWKPARLAAKVTLPAVFMAIHIGFAWGSAGEAARQFARSFRH
jgi:succinoglycan biosynthesis protein ExoA